MDDTEQEWNTHGMQIYHIEVDAEKNCREVLSMTNQIKEVVMENIHIFANKWCRAWGLFM